jgi:hypothetical protein
VTKLEQAKDKYSTDHMWDDEGASVSTLEYAFEAGAKWAVDQVVEFLEQSGQHSSLESRIAAIKTLLS